MIDSAADIARRLKREAKKSDPLHGASRHHAGWRLALTYGDPTPEQAKAFIVERFGQEFYDKVPEDAENTGLEWHLSASWRGGFPVEAGKLALDELLVALGVPEDKRTGFEFARVAGSPQVTHWMWSEK